MTIQEFVSGIQALVILVIAGGAAYLGYQVGGWGAAVVLWIIVLALGAALDSLDRIIHKILR